MSVRGLHGRGPGGVVELAERRRPMNANANAELSMRVKALEADVAWLRQREKLITEQLLALTAEVAQLRMSARRVF